VVVGVLMINSVGPASEGPVSSGTVYVNDSVVIINQNRFTNCTAVSRTDSSLGSFSVFGGAFAMLHSLQLSNFRIGLLMPSVGVRHVKGFSLTILIYKSFFFECSVFSDALSVRPGESTGGGGAIYAKSAALTHFNVTESIFNSTIVTVSSGATGLPSFSSGGALAVEAGDSQFSLVAISSCIFFNCTAQGTNIDNMGVLGGAIHIFRAAQIILIGTNFTNCNIFDADSDAAFGNVISGGSAISAVVTGKISIRECVFDSSGGRDTSRTSNGVLVLARNASNAYADVSSCEFISSTVVLSVQCVGDDGVRRFAGSCVGPNVALKHSQIRQVQPLEIDSRFSATGSDLLALLSYDTVSFEGSELHCASYQFAAFRSQVGNSSTRSTLYSCRPCPSFEISLTASHVSLKELSNAKNVGKCFPVSSFNKSVCPFAVADCRTFVYVSRGFWTSVSESGNLGPALRCPVGYCGCSDVLEGSCYLPPLISIDRNRDPLCNGNRIGKLCGGCPSDFTQSLDDITCISNEVCSKNLWWVWTLSIIGFVLYGLYIVLSCQKRAEGALACLVFYFQISSFLSDDDQRNGWVTFFEYAHVHFIVSMYQDACYAPSMSSYNATAFRLIGPLLVLLFAVAWTWIMQKLQPMLQKRSIDIVVSYSGTLAVAVLFVFSNVANVIFSLLECSSYSDPDAVVFIDGTVPCKDTKWNFLVFVAVLLFLFPIALVVTLRLKKFPPSARDAVCGKFTQPMFYWGALTLSFRLLISFTQFMQVDFPNLMAFVRSLLSMGVLVLLVYLRPYVRTRTFWVDVACYVCLIVQFGLHIIVTTRNFLGVAESSDDTTQLFFRGVSTWTTVIRCAFLLLFYVFTIHVYVSMQIRTRNCICNILAEYEGAFGKFVKGYRQAHSRPGKQNLASIRSVGAKSHK
jgi:hypothetical protein